ncbi:MAG TPA: DNA primase, partial [Chitinophagaceae bacterium]|nr:DNA primase [Chitinophagaceae bacterium]
LDIALQDAAADSTKKAAVVNQVAETISKINKAEDFTKQQDYIRQCAQLLKIDESGLHALVNKFIRNRIVTQEKALPFEEAKKHEDNARTAEQTDYTDATFNLLFKDELQEREFARILIEYGNLRWNESQRVAEYIFNEVLDESLLDNGTILKLIRSYRDEMAQHGQQVDKNFFIYHPDTEISSLSVALLNFPYEESEHWRREYSQSTGYQKQLFEQSYENFIRTLDQKNEKELMRFLKMDEDRTLEQVTSAINYFLLRKIRKMLLENQKDLEKPHTAAEFETLQKTHEHLKKMEQEITRQTGTVILH